jgi:NADH-quinone oxidoreductase subunit L
MSSWLQDETFMAVLLTTGLPFISFLLIMIFTRGFRRLSASLSIFAVTVSLIGAIFLLARHTGEVQPVRYAATWMVAGGFQIPFGYLVDPVSLLMLLLVAAVSLFVQVYSLGYMAGDPGFSRYYGFQSLFAWAMLTLTVSSSLLQLYVFWELVGLSSYLLIGFWYEKFSATDAGKKAFVMTRLGDVSFFIGLLLLLIHLGSGLDILTLNAAETAARLSSGLLTFSALLIFGGVVGKSAQFPLMTWLPDAMQGPTPVSALLHSATMVAAGVYLVARLFPFFSHSPDAMVVFLAVGTISMLMASTMAMVSRDIKQVWAYSTISQLGFMLMGLAAGSLFAGVFHLTTHAGFKALLFLCSGIWVHRYETNDIYEISERGGRRLKVATVSLIIAAAALSGLPPLSGFFSKEAILAALVGLENPFWVGAGLLGVFLTGYYAFRPVFILLFPRRIVEETAVHHSGAASLAMAGPLFVLAAVTVVLGFFERPLSEFLSPGAAVRQDVPHTWLPYAGAGLAVLAVIVAWLEFGRRAATQVGFVERIPSLKNFFLQRWYLDHLYRALVHVVVDRGFSRICTKNEDKVINDSIDAFSLFTLTSGRFFALLQSGKARYNLTVMFAAMAVAILCLLFT